MQITTIGLDIAKNVFQVHAADAAGAVMLRKRLRRNQVLDFFARQPRCLVGLEACASGHHWAREIAALGHDVRLLPPQYVKPYVKRDKNDVADAEAICEAVTRPTMRFVPVKTKEQQAVLMLHRARELLVRQQTMTVNAIRAHLAEFGIVVAQGIQNVGKAVAIIEDEADARLPDIARETLRILALQFGVLKERIAELKAKIVAWHRADSLSRRLATIPGIGPITASALAASVADPGQFRSARQFSAWLGLVPRQHSTGGKEMLGAISKRGNPYLRRLLVTAAQSVLRWKVRRLADASQWLRGLIARRPHNVVATALANKIARVAWAVWTKGEDYRAPHLAAV
jgi:transposase